VAVVVAAGEEEAAGFLEQCLVAVAAVEGETQAWDTAEGAADT